MFEEIIRNPIETRRGYKNADTGIALRGPLSQFFGAIYLKSLDDAFDAMQVTYIRYMDDIVILCKTKRQLARCRRRLMEILQERKMKLARKKTRMGPISTGFHFCGIDYPGTQTLDNTIAEDTQSTDYVSSIMGGATFWTMQLQIGSHYAACADTAKRPRTSQINGRHWIFCQTDQTIFEAMGAVVGRNSRNMGR